MVVSRVGNSDTFTVTTPSDCEIRMTRLFDAPRQLVFEAMTKPEHVRRWWGILDDGAFGPGVRDRFASGREVAIRRPRADRETSRPSTASFARSCRPSAWSRRNASSRFPMRESVVTTLLTEEDGKTRVTVTSVYPSKDVRDMVLRTGMEKGAAISYDRLEDVANELATGRTR